MYRYVSFSFVLALACFVQPALGGWEGRVKEILSDYKVFVFEAEVEFGGIGIRFVTLDLETEEEVQAFAEAMRQVQEVINVYEVHLKCFPNDRIRPDGLQFLEALPELRLISLGGANYDTKDLRFLEGKEHLSHIYLSGDGFGKDSLLGLGKVKADLDVVRIRYAKMAWEHFPALSVQILDATSSTFDDAGAANVAPSERLVAVYAFDTQLTDVGLLKLTDAKALKVLAVTGKNFSAEAIAKFRAARPDVSLATERPRPQRPPQRFHGPMAMARR